MKKTINSVSGGKTSAYLAINYPADFNIFSLVCINDKACSPKDKRLIQKVNDKLDKNGYIEKYGEFVATAELDQTLSCVFELEQALGKEIIWVRGLSFEDLIKQKGCIPNMARRFCTTELKMVPIATYVYHNIEYPVISNVGFRFDESRRQKDNKKIITKIIVGKRGSRNRWEEVYWGDVNYPLIDDMIDYFEIINFWKDKIDFPMDSNCVGCFWKGVQRLRKNFEEEPSKMKWFEKVETESNYNWKSNITYENIKNIGLQKELPLGFGSGCNSGFCTD